MFSEGINQVRVLEGQILISDKGYRYVDTVGRNRLLSLNQEYRKVERIERDGDTSHIYELVINGFFNPLGISESNEILVYKGKKNQRCFEKSEWVLPKDVKVGDMLVYNVENNINPRDYLKDYLQDNNVATFLGYYTLEGFINKEKGRVTFHVDPKFPEMEEDVSRVCEEAFSKEVDRYEYEGEHFISVDGEDGIIQLCELFGGKNRDSVIPEEVINSDINFLSNYIKPMLKLNKDKRGSYFRPSASLDLVLGFQRALMRMNSFANIYYCVSKNNRFSYYAVIMNSTELNKALSFVPGEDSSWFRSGDCAYLRVNSIGVKEEKKKVYKVHFRGDSYCNYLMYLR